MKRRTAMVLMGSAALAAARANAAERVIGWISPESREASAPFFKAFMAGLNNATSAAGTTVRVIERYGVVDPALASQRAAELQTEGASLIVAQGAAAYVVSRAKPSLPVVFAYSGDPVVAGIVQSMARPGSTFTGVSFMAVELNPKRIDLLRRALPQCRRVALVSNALHFGEENEIVACQRAVEVAGVELTVWRTDGASNIQAVIAQALDTGPEGLVVLPSAPMVRQARETAAQCLARKVPMVSGWASIARAGALLTYGPNLDNGMMRVATYAVRVLNGEAPANLPVEQPTTFELTINKRTAQALGIVLPAALMAQADEIIE